MTTKIDGQHKIHQTHFQIDFNIGTCPCCHGTRILYDNEEEVPMCKLCIEKLRAERLQLDITR